MRIDQPVGITNIIMRDCQPGALKAADLLLNPLQAFIDKSGNLRNLFLTRPHL